MKEVQTSVTQWKAYDGTVHTSRDGCENHERGCAKLNAGSLTVRALIHWIHESTFQSGQDIGFIGEILHERKAWERGVKEDLKKRAEELAEKQHASLVAAIQAETPSKTAILR